MFTAYLIGFFAILVVAAIRNLQENIRVILALAIFWPLTVLFTIFDLSLTAIGWDFDFKTSTNFFGFRKPLNKTGFAITIMKIEFQFWSKK